MNNGRSRQKDPGGHHWQGAGQSTASEKGKECKKVKETPERERIAITYGRCAGRGAPRRGKKKERGHGKRRELRSGRFFSINSFRDGEKNQH